MMADKLLHHQKTNLWDVHLLERLIPLFERLNQSAGELATCAEADFRSRMLPLKHCEKQLRQLNAVNENSNAGSTPDWLDTTQANLSAGYATLIKALVQIQFYDRLQQQVAHIRQTYPEITEELRALRRTKGDATTLSIDYLYALPEIVELHREQLASTRVLFEAELSEWKKQLRFVEEQVQGLLIQEGINQLPEVQLVVPEIVSQLQILQQANDGFLHFEAISFTMQTHFSEVSLAVSTLPIAPEQETTSDVLARIRSRYTMQSERNLHDSTLSEKPDPESSRPSEIHNQDIELF